MFPTQTRVQVCKTDMHRYCENFSNIVPFPVEEQNCHTEPKKSGELEIKTRSKRAKKKYNYTEDCKEQPKGICDQCVKKSLKPVCVMQDTHICTYEPEGREEAALPQGGKERLLHPVLEVIQEPADHQP